MGGMDTAYVIDIPTGDALELLDTRSSARPYSTVTLRGPRLVPIETIEMDNGDWYIGCTDSVAIRPERVPTGWVSEVAR